jgi:CHAT domain-containing protein
MLDERVVSYAPTLRALSLPAGADRAGNSEGLLVVADPRPSKLPSITVADSEAAWAASRIPGATVLEGDSATLERVSPMLRKVGIFHFACHGLSRPLDPLNSAICLAGDERLTLRNIMSLQPRQNRARLAVLSSCDTDQPGVELPDEVVSLPVGFLQAGVMGVIAAQWAVRSQATALLVSRFYIAWRDDGYTPSEALTVAQRWLRDTTNAEKARFFEKALDRPDVPNIDSGKYKHRQKDLVRILQFREPDRKDDSDPSAWAALAYHGV